MILDTPEIREAVTYRSSLPLGSDDRADAFHDVAAAVAAANPSASEVAVDMATLALLRVSPLQYLTEVSPRVAR